MAKAQISEEARGPGKPATAGKTSEILQQPSRAGCQNQMKPVMGQESVTGSGGVSMAKAVSYAQWSLEPYCIGLKLRSLRTQKRLTLSRLAAETGLSTALLSKLETDRMIPTLPTLATISRVYGVGMSYFFAEPARHTLSITRKAHFEGDGRGPEPVKVTPLNAAGRKSRAGGADDRILSRADPPVPRIAFARRAAWFTCWKAACSWTPAACRRCWRRAIAPALKAKWPWPGARLTSIAAASWRYCPASSGRRLRTAVERQV